MTTPSSDFDDDIIVYENSPMRQCISGFGNNAIETLHALDAFSDAKDRADAKGVVEYSIRELVGWCRAFNRKVTRLRSIAARLGELEAERDKLRTALIGLCSEDAPCLCEDWMVTPPGTKCVYCVARAALA